MSIIEVDDRFVDVDFIDEMKKLRIQPGYFGESPYASSFENLSTYEDSVELLSNSQIAEAVEQQEEEGGLEEYITRIFDQKREGSCVSQACGQGNQIIQAKKYGKDQVIQLSAISLYKQIGRSPSSGASVSNGMRKMASLGLLPLNTNENRTRFGSQVMNNVGFYDKYPEGWKETAKHFRIVEYHVVRSVQGILSALARQEPVVVGREGHSIVYVKAVRKNNGYNILYPNSWSTRWGFKVGEFSGGFGMDSMRQLQKSGSWAFVIRDVVARDLDFRLV